VDYLRFIINDFVKSVKRNTGERNGICNGY